MDEIVYDDLRDENLCIICLENINLKKSKVVCKACNVKSHISCLKLWYIKKEKKVCPICLKCDEYYSNSENSDIGIDIDDTNEEINNQLNNRQINYIEFNGVSGNCKRCITVFTLMGFFYFILLLQKS